MHECVPCRHTDTWRVCTHTYAWSHRLALHALKKENIAECARHEFLIWYSVRYHVMNIGEYHFN